MCINIVKDASIAIYSKIISSNCHENMHFKNIFVSDNLNFMAYLWPDFLKTLVWFILNFNLLKKTTNQKVF